MSAWSRPVTWCRFWRWDFLAEDWRQTLLRDPCVYCAATATGLDHVTPRARLGGDGWENRAPACAECDNRKGSTPLLWFLVAVERPTSAWRYRRRVDVVERPVPPLRWSLADIFLGGSNDHG